MRRLLSLVPTLFGLLAAAGAASAQPQMQRGDVLRVPVTGVVELGLAPFIERSVREAEAAGAAAVVLDIETPGGRVDAAQRIVNAVGSARVPVYAYVNMRAYSAGAMIALAAERVYMRPGAVIGAATPVDGSGAKAPEKIVSAMRSEMRALAQRRGLDPRVAEAMVDENIEVEGVTERGQLLSLTAAEAEAIGYAEEVADWDALMAAIGVQDARVVTADVNWAERVVRFLTHPVVAPMLLSLGFLGIIIELKTAAFGLAGVAGAASLAAFFGSHWLLGLAGWEELILLGAGIVLIGVEMFVLPGLGIIGFLGAGAILAALYLSLVSPMSTGAEYMIDLGLFSLAIIVMLVVAWGLLRHLTRTGSGTPRSGIMLGDATTRERGYLSGAVRAELIGSTGVALTDLRPAGAARFGAERLDVVTDSSWINAGTQIRIVRSDGYRHVVEPVE